MKRKFLITNDVGLAQDKVNHAVSVLRSEDFDQQYLHELDDVLVEALIHLQQALDNLVFEEDFTND